MNYCLVVTDVLSSLWVLEAEVALAFRDHPAIVRERMVRQEEATIIAETNCSFRSYLVNEICVSGPGDREDTTVPRAIRHRWRFSGGRWR